MRLKLGAAAVLLLLTASLASAETRLGFLGVALDQDTRNADRKLLDYLYRKGEVAFAPTELEYERMIDRLATWKPEEGEFVARVTPYVYVAAEMLGARLEVLATYVSDTTGEQTYFSYLVVPRRHFSAPPTLPDVLRFLSKQRRRFVYHSALSTSSFFLPSLYFRKNRVYHMDESTESLVAINSQRIAENSSSRLVELVAQGEADIAAVWDGVKRRFEAGGASEALGRQVYFVQLPTAIPNDMLICSASLERDVKDRLRAAISSMSEKEIGTGDFRTWASIRDATSARTALAELRWLAREAPARVTVDIRLPEGRPVDRRAALLLESARQAVRLSGTEFVLFDGDFHEQIDYVWTVEPIHDNAVLLRSQMPGAGIPDQVFDISFRDGQDLARRMVSILTGGIHRVRYAWPYSGTTPVVIRDTAFPVPVGAKVKVQRIRWLHPERNMFRAGEIVEARIADSDFFKYKLNAPGVFPEGVSLDPLSNESFRVLLLRPVEERRLFRVLTVVFIALLALAALGGAMSLARRARDERP
jgi:ABC-type phosphate/phosphonate transport system substrate-binding protein